MKADDTKTTTYMRANIWNHGINTWNWLSPFGVPEWECHLCQSKKKQFKYLKSIEEHIVTQEHKDRETWAKLSGEYIYTKPWED